MKAISEFANLQRCFTTHPLTCDAPLRAWVRFALWQLRSRLQGEIIFRWIGGQRLAVRHGMSGATQNIYVGLHEFADMMLALHFLREGDLFLDIGSNVGTYTVLASGVCRAKTWAFEPDPGTVQRLRRNIAVNSLDTYVQVHECALGAGQGEVAFTVGCDSVNKIATADDKNVRIVRLEPLDAIVASSEPIMIKVDVEGAEEGVLQGAKGLLANPCLKVVEMETVTPESTSILGRNQFDRAYYDPFCRSLHREPIDLKSSNSLFVRDWSFVATRLAAAKKVQILGREI
ncbi:MAG: FkbM family methyltransferase [Terracidiphilus sp.]